MENKELLTTHPIKEIKHSKKLMSDKIDKIIPDLIAATLSMPTPEKSQSGNRGPYSDLEDYINCCKKILAQHNILLYQHPEYYSDLKTRIMHSTLFHTSGQWLDATDIANPDPALVEAMAKKGLPYQQAVSTVFTYTKRRLLQSQLSLGCDNED